MSFAFLNFHFIPFISPSLLCFYNCGAVGSTRPTSPLLSSFGQKLYTRCLFSSGSPGKRLLYYFPVFRTQFSITHINDLFALSLRYATFQNYFKSRITLIVITRDVHFLSNIRNFGVLILTSKISPRYCLREIYRSGWRQRTICDSLQFNN